MAIRIIKLDYIAIEIIAVLEKYKMPIYLLDELLNKVKDQVMMQSIKANDEIGLTAQELGEVLKKTSK